MYVDVSTFERHVRWLARRYQIVTLSDAVEAQRRGRAQGLAVITFDDGWRDNLTQAWPVLERYDARATIFLVADWIRGEAKNDGRYLSPADVKFLFGHGIELGAHTVSHPKLDELNPERIALELQASKDAVADWTGSPCRTFAYPFGRFNDAALTIAARTFEASVRVGGGWWGPSDSFERLPRISIHDDVTRWVPMFEARLAGIF